MPALCGDVLRLTTSGLSLASSPTEAIVHSHSRRADYNHPLLNTAYRRQVCPVLASKCASSPRIPFLQPPTEPPAEPRLEHDFHGPHASTSAERRASSIEHTDCAVVVPICQRQTITPPHSTNHVRASPPIMRRNPEHFVLTPARFEKSLYDLIRGLRNHKGNEKEYIQSCLKECRSEIRSQDMG